jgi:diguanylate cyclase (GGDEF)-like protein
MSLHAALTRLYDFFLRTIQHSQEKLVDFDPAEIQAACLESLATLGQGTAVLLALDAAGLEFRLELASGALGIPAERLRFPVSSGELQALAKNPDDLAGVAGLKTLLNGLAGPAAFAGGLLSGEKITGMLLLLPDRDHPLTDADREDLRLLTQQIRTLLQTADLFSVLVSQAMIDDLTGLFNHRYFSTRLPAELSRASRHGHPLSLLFCDIDDFKSFNDRHGHTAGNRLLAEISELFRSGGRRSDVVISFRNSDIPIRFGGEEFALILPETPKWGALTKAERLRKAIESMTFLEREHPPGHRVTISIGVASFPEDAAEGTALLEAADRALAKAKQSGKNRVEAAQ